MDDALISADTGAVSAPASVGECQRGDADDRRPEPTCVHQFSLHERVGPRHASAADELREGLALTVELRRARGASDHAMSRSRDSDRPAARSRRRRLRRPRRRPEGEENGLQLKLGEATAETEEPDE
jgi:hypothetical protein